MEELLEFISGIIDVRQEWKVEHKLKDIVVIVLFATLANAEDWKEIEIFARENQELLKKYIELKNGAMSHDTIQRVMASIDPEVMKGLYEVWTKMSQAGEGERIKRILNIDGKTIRGNGNKNQEALHIVSAWSKEGGVCFGQKAVEGKGNEIRAIKELLKVIKVKDQIVTIDAIGTQKEIAEKIIEKNGDYVLAVKRNQENLYEDIKTYFEEESFTKKIEEKEIYVKTIEKAHGQIEKREYYQTRDIGWMYEKEKWKGIKTIGMVKTRIKSERGEKEERRYYISSLDGEKNEFEKAVRGHWAIESMHWHLDVTFREDKNRTLEKTAAENMNIIRKWSLSILKLLEVGTKRSLKKKRFTLSCNFGKFIESLMTL
jgi:predicted transposase YbfD/YdcC